MPGTELGKAYVQIVPSAKGIQSSLEKELGGPGEEAGKSAGSKIGAGIKAAIIAAGIGTAIKAAVSEGAKMEQSFGGLDTIYGVAADEAKRYAAEAAKAGISANDYAEQAVGFGASLKQAFGGDTVKAVEAANTAILDMTDNAAKMGTPIESIQNAYAGFAKQNYTMLDNLKLGYGGTKTEMERLLKDAQKISGVEYNIDNLGDVYDAIHVIQGELGLTGVAAAEASTTLSGSLGAMKAALSNTLGNLALGEDVGPSLSALGETVTAFLTNNLIPMAKNVVMALPELAKALAEQAPTLLMSLAQSLIESLPVLIPAVVDAVMTIADKLTEPDTLVMLIDAALQLILALADGLVKAIPRIVERIPTIIVNIVKALIRATPQIVKAGFELLLSLGRGLVSGIVSLGRSLWQVTGTIREKISGLARSALQWGKDLIANFVQGIKNKVSAVTDAVKGVASKVKGFLGFSEPDEGPLSNFHTYAPDMLKLFAQGIRDNEHLITDQIGKSFDFGNDIVDMNINTSSGFVNGVGTNNTIGAVSINVYPDPGMDEAEFAEKVSYTLQNMFDRRAASLT